jgi:septum site-determining protein MinD
LIINRLDANMVRRGQMLGTEDVIELLAIELLGIVPEDKEIIVSSNQGTPVALNGRTPSGQAFRNIAGRLMGQDIPFMALKDTSGILQIFGRLIRG